MNKSIFGFICAIISGLILFLGVEIARKYGIEISNAVVGWGVLLCVAVLFVALNDTLKARLLYVGFKIDWAEEIINAYLKISPIYRKSFWIIFGFVNLAFLFHTIHFMWGGDDWHAIRGSVAINDGLKEGRFSAYWLQSILFDGKILPILNNLWAFIGVSLAGVLLCKYWKIKESIFVYVLVGLVFAITPYALGWLYFAKNTLGNLWLPAVVLCALLLADKKANSLNLDYFYNLISIFLLVFALGTYLPVINFIAVVMIGKIILALVSGQKDVIFSSVQGFTNLTASLMLYAFIVIILKDKGIMVDAYNTRLEPVLYMFLKIPYWGIVAVEQFFVPVPFMGIGYKFLYMLITLIAMFVVIFKSQSIKNSFIALGMVFLAILFSKLTYLISVQSYDNLPHLVRIDYYGVPVLFTLMLAIIVSFSGDVVKRVGYGLACIVIFASFVQIAYALKVWKFGWDAETKLAERIITRLEKLPEFDIEKKYKLLQVGEMSLRKNYYTKVFDDVYSPEMLDKAYYQQGNAKDAYNFFYHVDFLSEDAMDDALENPMVKEYLKNKAQPWPASGAVGIVGEYIIIVL